VSAVRTPGEGPMLPRSVVAAVLGTALVAALTGCSIAGNTATPAGSSSSAAPRPESVLAAAGGKTTRGSLKVILTGAAADENLTGSYDATHKIGSIAQVSGTDRMSIVVTADDMYLAGLSDFKGKTMRLRIAKLSPKSPLAMFADALAPLTLLSGVTEVSASAPTSFTGTLDLAKAHG